MSKKNSKKMRLAVLGAGSRGRAYSEFSLLNPDKLVICAVAEPNEFRRNLFGEKFGVPEKYRYSSWRALLQDKPSADAVLIATPDRDHVEPVVAFSDLGYNILLEKPMSVDHEGCVKISEAVKRNRILFGICHVLLYTPHTQLIKKLLGTDRIGDVVSLQRLEPVGYWHYVHSYVRGNWRREDTSSSMLLAKSCHDIDWILHVMGGEVSSVSSFGSLNHFRKENKPEGASSRCFNCSIEASCPFSAPRFYSKILKEGNLIWPLDTVIDELSIEALDIALQSGPYGRCVYSCDNNVVDNQVVNLNFSENRTASLSVLAFTDVSHRKTRIFGTRGMLDTDGNKIQLYDFLSDTWEKIEVDSSGASASEGHGGGDFGLMTAYIKAWETGDHSFIKRNIDESCLSHEVIFAAEKARLENTVKNMV
jgi:hypothetical protein